MVDNLRKLANDFNRTLGFEPFIEACMKCGKRNEALFYINQLKDQNLANSYKQQLGVNQKHPLKDFFSDTFGFEIGGSNDYNSYRKPENIFGKSDVEMAEESKATAFGVDDDEEVEESNPFGDDNEDDDEEESNPFGRSSSSNNTSNSLKEPPSMFSRKLPSINEVNTPFSSSSGSVAANPFGSDDNLTKKTNTNPFGRDNKASEENPFGSDSIDEGNPFGRGSSIDGNPFEPRTGRDRRSSVGNPFGGSFGDWFD